MRPQVQVPKFPEALFPILQIFALLLVLTGAGVIFIQNSSHGKVHNGCAIQYSKPDQDAHISSEVNLLPILESKNNLPHAIAAPGQGGLESRMAVRQNPYSRSFHSKLITGIKSGTITDNNMAFSTIAPSPLNSRLGAIVFEIFQSFCHFGKALCTSCLQGNLDILRPAHGYFYIALSFN